MKSLKSHNIITLSTTTITTHNPKAYLWAHRFPASSLKYSSTTLNRPTYSMNKTISTLIKYYIGTDMWMTYYSYTMGTTDKPIHQQTTPKIKFDFRNRSQQQYELSRPRIHNTNPSQQIHTKNS